MGHKEDLLEGAKRCLVAKGFVRTTARDIVAESGTNLGSIGYHYGSKDALLVQAFVALMEQAGEGFAPSPPAAAGSLERFREVWAGVMRWLPEMRPLWLLSVELVAYGDQLPEVHRLIADSQLQGRSGIMALFTDVPEAELSPDTLDSEGRFYQTLLQGLMVPWIFDPETATDADQLTEGLRRVIAAAGPPAPSVASEPAPAAARASGRARRPARRGPAAPAG